MVKAYNNPQFESRYNKHLFGIVKAENCSNDEQQICYQNYFNEVFCETILHNSYIYYQSLEQRGKSENVWSFVSFKTKVELPEATALYTSEPSCTERELKSVMRKVVRGKRFSLLILIKFKKGYN